MAEQDKKGTGGGRREGSGRKKGTSRQYNFRADKEVATYIDSHLNKTDFIKDCIVKQMQSDKSLPDEETLSSLGQVTAASKVRPMSLPFFDVKIVAGFPIPLNNDEMAQDIELLRMLCPNPDSSYLIRVQGLSMIEAGVHDGDILIVDKSQRNPTEKQIAVCELNGEYTVKLVQQRNGKRWLVPANSDFPMMEIKEGDSFSVWGVVTFIIHKPNI